MHAIEITCWPLQKNTACLHARTCCIHTWDGLGCYLQTLAAMEPSVIECRCDWHIGRASQVVRTTLNGCLQTWHAAVVEGLVHAPIQGRPHAGAASKYPFLYLTYP